MGSEDVGRRKEGSSKIRPIITELERIATSHVIVWEARTWRGGMIQHVTDMVDNKKVNMQNAKWALRFIGGNGMANMERGERRGGEK